MTGFIAMYNVAYEGSHVIGFFNTLEDAINHIKNDRHFQEYWNDGQLSSNNAYQKIENSAASWWVGGNHDISFSFYQVAGVEHNV